MGEFSWDKVPLAAQPTTPGAGANFLYTVPAGYRARLYVFTYKYQTDGNAANRITVFGADSGAGIGIISKSWELQTATQTNYYYLGAGYANSDGADQVARYQATPGFVDLEAGYRIQVSITLKEVGDQVTPKWLMKLVKL